MLLSHALTLRVRELYLEHASIGEEKLRSSGAQLWVACKSYSCAGLSGRAHLPTFCHKPTTRLPTRRAPRPSISPLAASWPPHARLPSPPISNVNFTAVHGAPSLQDLGKKTETCGNTLRQRRRQTLITSSRIRQRRGENTEVEGKESRRASCRNAWAAQYPIARPTRSGRAWCVGTNRSRTPQPRALPNAWVVCRLVGASTNLGGQAFDKEIMRPMRHVIRRRRKVLLCLRSHSCHNLNQRLMVAWENDVRSVFQTHHRATCKENVLNSNHDSASPERGPNMRRANLCTVASKFARNSPPHNLWW